MKRLCLVGATGFVPRLRDSNPGACVRSIIGNGLIWYFVCPKTGNRCRKLYLVDGYFYHREAFTGCFYEKQTYSRAKRDLCKQYENYFGVEQAYDKIYSKHFKKQYNAKPTKRFLKLQQSILKGEGINEEQLYSIK